MLSAGVSLEIFQGRREGVEGGQELRHFDKHLSKTQEIEVPQRNILEFFLLDKLKIAF